ncbi:hypothetical protein C8Q76DRAFT_623696 [Earliella scabrosa]|nr:hypothetical protein C8Q76DRAFT_623696 [Earliella scabrosa]
MLIAQYSNPLVFLDLEERAFMVGAGQPRDAQWPAVCHEATRVLDSAGQSYQQEGPANVRRGEYPTITCGISYGGGQKRVSNVAQSPRNQTVVDKIVNSLPFRRLSGFVDASFKLFAPKLYEDYRSLMGGLRQHHPDLRPAFGNNVFVASTFNLGGNVATYIHTDHLNYASGWCAVVALGDFNPDVGGHLVLWDLGIVLRFPPGSLLFLPSAILRHSNVVVPEGQRRYSFTQYTAGGLFRWQECGYRSQKDFLAAGHRYDLSGWQRWRSGVERYSTLSELRSPVS